MKSGMNSVSISHFTSGELFKNKRFSLKYEPAFMRMNEYEWYDRSYNRRNSGGNCMLSNEHSNILLLKDGKTAALLGSSGVGKSSLTNALCGENVMTVQNIREDDDKGRHTTTHRELFRMPGGGLLIDTPGMREFQMWDNSESLDTGFKDVEQFASSCRFSDCQHTNQPGCAVQEALENGSLTRERYASYEKLKRELAYVERKADAAAQKAERGKWKQITKDMRKRPGKKR